MRAPFVASLPAWFMIVLTGASPLLVAGSRARGDEPAKAQPSGRAERPAPAAAKAEPAAAHTQSEEVKAFRKTAIPVTFPSDGLTLQGWIYKPAGDGPFPALVWNHGSERNPRAHPELGLFYTRHGYVVFLPVRSGHAPSPGKYIQDVLQEYQESVQKDVALVQQKIVELHSVYNKDVVAALAWLREQPYVDRDQIVVSGCSYGGIQTLVTSEKGLGVRAFVPFAPGAMSWANPALRARLIETVKHAKAPLFLLQAENDYSTGPSEVLGPLIRGKGGPNRAKVYPAFGTTPQEGHGGFACWDEGIAIWGKDVLAFLESVGVGRTAR